MSESPVEDPPLFQQHVCITGSVVDVFVESSSPSVQSFHLRKVGVMQQWITLFDMMLFAVGLLVHLPSLYQSSSTGTEANSSGVVLWMDSSVFVWFISVFAVLLVFLRIVLRSRSVAEELVTAIHGVGLQVSSKNSFGKTLSTKFIDIGMLQSLFIHEGYFRHQVIYYAGVVVQNQEKITVLLENFLPRLNVLREVLRGIRHVLYGEAEHGMSLAQKELQDKLSTIE